MDPCFPTCDCKKEDDFMICPDTVIFLGGVFFHKLLFPGKKNRPGNSAGDLFGMVSSRDPLKGCKRDQPNVWG